MKIATSIVVAAALVLASAPAFAHGGGMGGNMGGNTGGNMGHSNGMTVTTQTHDWHPTNVTNIGKTTTKTRTFFFKRLEFVQREIQRIDREIFRLVRLGRGNSRLVKVLQFRKIELLQGQHVG